MAPKKQGAATAQDSAAGPAGRPRRSVQPKQAYAPEPSESDDASSSDMEEPQERRRGRPASQKATASAATASAKRTSQRLAGASATGTAAGRSTRAPATQSGRTAAASKRVGGKTAAATALDDGASSSGSESESESSGAEGSDSDVMDVTEQDQEATKRTAGRPARGATRATAAAAQKAAPARSRAGSAAAKPAAASTAAAAAAAGTLQPDAARRKPAATAAAALALAAKPRAGAAATAADESEEEDEEEQHAREDDSEEGEEQEEEEEEEEEQPAGAAGRRATLGTVRGRGAKQLVPPTAADSRKRLFELLERRVGGATGGGGGADAGVRRVLYGDLPPKNPNKKAKLLVDLRSQFDDWHSRLRSNFSVLLYGFGSKRGLLEEFARLLAGPRNRGDAAVLAFQGYNPRCTAREVITAVAGALMQRSFKHVGTAAGGGGAGGAGGGGAHGALRALVEEIRAEPRDRHAFVVIHNLDGPGLRPDVSLLSALAACPQVHLIASVDHALAPLLWDSADAARFRWQYINATTFQPYLAETSGAQSVLMGAFKSGVVTAGAGTVLRSLVLGAQEVFKVLAEHLLEDEECEGVAFAHLYRMCKERYLVRDERVLRQHLVEFVDHALVRLRPASDNSGELLTIPMSRPDMQAVLDDLAAARG